MGCNWGSPWTREWWQSPLDDDWKYGAQVVLAHTYGRGSQVALTYGVAYIPHDAWLAADAEGNGITNAAGNQSSPFGSRQRN